MNTASRNGWRLLRADTRGDRGVGLVAPIRCLRQRPNLLWRDVSGHYQDGVVGRIEAPIESLRVLERESAHLVLPAQGRSMIWMIEVEGGEHLLAQDAERVGVHAGAALLQDHVALRQHLGLHQPQVHHAIRFQLHHAAQMLLGNALIVGRRIVRGRCVVAPAEPGDDARKLSRLDLAGRLEHEVLEEMGDARGSPRIVRSAGAVPHHVGDDRHPMIGDHHDIHAVGELERAHLRLGAGMASRQPQCRNE